MTDKFRRRLPAGLCGERLGVFDFRLLLRAQRLPFQPAPTPPQNREDNGQHNQTQQQTPKRVQGKTGWRLHRPKQTGSSERQGKPRGNETENLQCPKSEHPQRRAFAIMSSHAALRSLMRAEIRFGRLKACGTELQQFPNEPLGLLIGDA